MNVSLLITVENSRPEISRCINVDSQLHLGDLAHVINAALGFSGQATHLFVLPTEGDDDISSTDRAVYTTSPGAGEHDETELEVAALPEHLSYVYDTSANWNVHVEMLGESAIDGPTPILIHATGPDVIEAVGGPDMMTRFHREAQRLAAGLEPSLEVTPSLFAHVPVMAPAHMVECLSVANPVTISSRISFIAEELIYNDFSTLPDGMPAPSVDDINDFIDSRPDLQEIMALDPNPASNPEILSAVAEFLDANYKPDFDVDKVPDDSMLEIHDVELHDRLYFWLLCYTRKDPPNDKRLHDLLRTAGLLDDNDALTEAGQRLMVSEGLPVELVKSLYDGFCKAFGKETWDQTIDFYLKTAYAPFLIQHEPECVDATSGLLINLGMLTWAKNGGVALTENTLTVFIFMEPFTSQGETH